MDPNQQDNRASEQQAYPYVKVYAFMANDLALAKCDLLIYARIFGFAMSGKPYFESKQGAADFFGISRRTVFNVMKRLLDLGLIEEAPPCRESRVIGSKCYRPCSKPLEELGVRLLPGESNAYETVSPGEANSPPDHLSGEAASPPPQPAGETDAPPVVAQVHPIPKTKNRFYR